MIKIKRILFLSLILILCFGTATKARMTAQIINPNEAEKTIKNFISQNGKEGVAQLSIYQPRSIVSNKGWHYRNKLNNKNFYSRFSGASYTHSEITFSIKKDDIYDFHLGLFNSGYPFHVPLFVSVDLYKSGNYIQDLLKNTKVRLTKGNYSVKYKWHVGYNHRNSYFRASYLGVALLFDKKEEIPPPKINTSSIYFTENKRSSQLINTSGGGGNLSYSTRGVPSGMRFRKVSNGYRVIWRPGYNVNNRKTSGSIRKTFKLTVRDSNGQSHTRNINVYVRNKHKPISNINNYKQTSNLPNKPNNVKYNKPNIPVFEENGNLYSKKLLTDITKYSFVEVEDKPPYPGDVPNIITKLKTSLVVGSSESINRSLISGNVNGYKDVNNQLDRYSLARDAYKSLDEFIQKQYNKDSDVFFDKLDRFVDYNNRNNYLGEKVELKDHKDYDNMEKIYTLLKQKLETRQGKLDNNIEKYNKYTKTVDEYNTLLDQKINSLIYQYKNVYIPEYNNWLNDKNEYLDDVKDKTNEYNNYNNNLYNAKVRKVRNGINRYGLVSLSVNNINKPPNLNSYYLPQLNNFDLNGIANIYNSLKDYDYLNEEVKNEIKMKFNDGVYNEEKFNWLKQKIKEDLTVDIKNSTDINNKYLIK